MKPPISLLLLFLSISAADIDLHQKRLLSTASNSSLADFAKAITSVKNLDCQDSMNNNFLHRLAMRKDNIDVFFAGVRLAVSKNYHQLLVQKNFSGLLPVDMAISNWPAHQAQIEANFFSAIMHTDDKTFDQPDKYFWSRLIAVSATYQINQKKDVRAKPY